MITVDTTKFAKRIQEWQKAAGIGAAEAVKKQARLFVHQCINRLTPPKTKSQGEEAINKDLKKIFTGVDSGLLDRIGSENWFSNLKSFGGGKSAGLTNIDLWLKNKAGNNVHLLWKQVDPSGTGMKKYHMERISSRMRAYNGPRIASGEWRANYVVSWDNFQNYLKKVIKHVGRLRAGWLPAAKALGVEIKPWVGRHASGAKGSVLMNISTGLFSKPSITISNRALGVSHIENVVYQALKIRCSAMARDMKLYIKGIKQRGT